MLKRCPFKTRQTKGRFEDMKQVPNQQEFEKFIDSLLSHGDKTAIAAWLDVSPEQIHQEFSPFNEKKSKLYQALRQLWAISEPNPQAATTIAEYILTSVRQWTCNRSDTSADMLTVNVVKEWSEFIIAELENRTQAGRLKEAIEARDAIEKYIEGLHFDGIEDANEIDEDCFPV